MLEEFLKIGANIVEARFAVGREDEAALRTFAPAVRLEGTFAAATWQGLGFGIAEPDLGWRKYHPIERLLSCRPKPIFRINIVITGIDTAVVPADTIRQTDVSEVTFYRWRREFGGLKADQVKWLKELELENSRLRKAVSDLSLDKVILTEAAKGN